MSKQTEPQTKKQKTAKNKTTKLYKKINEEKSEKSWSNY